MSNLHAQITNLPASTRYTGAQSFLYKEGHRDACHAAAELVNKADAEKAELVKALQYCREAIRTGKFTATNIAQVDEIIAKATKLDAK